MPFSKLKSLNKTDRIFFIIAVILTVTYFLSFLRTTDKSKKNGVKSALVNEKYLPSISRFIIKGDNILSIQNNGKFWTITENNSGNSIPADEKIINNFLSELTTIRNMYKISDKNNSKSNFSLSDGSEITLRYYYSDKAEDFYDIIFGGHDFSNNSRYIMSGKNTAVYEIDTNLDSYITTSVQFWSEPYIISSLACELKNGIKAADVQAFYCNEGEAPLLKKEFPAKLLELRHGGFAENFEDSDDKIIFNFYIQLGNKKDIYFSVYETSSESYYNIKAEYGNYTAYYKISAWTYKSISEMIL